MNREWVLHHLGEASEELIRTIDEMGKSPDYDSAEFSVAMMHLYHHLNTAWNSREANPERVTNESDEDFRAWSQYPTDLPVME